MGTNALRMLLSFLLDSDALSIIFIGISVVYNDNNDAWMPVPLSPRNSSKLCLKNTSISNRIE